MPAMFQDQRRRWALRVAVLAIVIVGGGIFLLPGGGPKYTRSQCIVRVDVKHQSGADVTESENHLFDKLLEYAFQPQFPAASVGFGNRDRSRIYVVFLDACERKFELTRAMADSYMDRYPAGARLTVSEEIIEPGANTVDIGGDYWIDGTAERRAKLLKQRGGQQ